MASKILIATPQPEFGELIRLNIEEGGEYEATLVKTGREVMELSNSTKFDLVILDASLPDKPFVPMAQNLLDENPRMKIIVLPPNNDPKDPSLEEIIYHGVLSRPFYPPDLVEMVNELLAPPPAANQPPEKLAVEPLPPPPASPIPPVSSASPLVPQVEPSHLPVKEENIGPINEEDFAKEVEALFAQQAQKTTPYDFIKEIRGTETRPDEPAPVPQGPFQEISEPAPSESQAVLPQPEEISAAEEDADAFAHLLAAQIRAETESKIDNTALEKEAEALLEEEPVSDVQVEPVQAVESVLEPEPGPVEQSNADFARQILSQVMKETAVAAESSEIPPQNESPVESPAESTKELAETIPTTISEPVAAEPEVPVTMETPPAILVPTPEIIPPSSENISPVNLEIPAIMEKPAETIAEDLEDEDANEAYAGLTKDDDILSQKHASMAARYAELASEYHALAREHADLAQRHAEIAAEKARLVKEKTEMLSRKRELVGEIYQTQRSLKDLLAETDAQAAIIVKSGDMVAQVGNLSHEAFLEVAAILMRYWDGDKKSDLIRFMRLETDHSEQLLYAASIREDFILGLIFEPAASISLMRTQAARVTHKLAEEPLMDMLKLPVEDLEKISREQLLEEAEMEPQEEPLEEFDAFGDLPKASLQPDVQENAWVPEINGTINPLPVEELSLPVEPDSNGEILEEPQMEAEWNPQEILKNVLSQLQNQTVSSAESPMEPADTVIEPLPTSREDIESHIPTDNRFETTSSGAQIQDMETVQPEAADSSVPDAAVTSDENPVDFNAILSQVNDQLDSQQLMSNEDLLTEAEALENSSENPVENQIPEWISTAAPAPEDEMPFTPPQEKEEPVETPSLPTNLYYDYEEDNWHIIRGVGIDQKKPPEIAYYEDLFLENDENTPPAAVEKVAPNPEEKPPSTVIDETPADQIYRDVLAQLQNQEISAEESVAMEILNQPGSEPVPAGVQEGMAIIPVEGSKNETPVLEDSDATDVEAPVLETEIPATTEIIYLEPPVEPQSSIENTVLAMPAVQPGSETPAPRLDESEQEQSRESEGERGTAVSIFRNVLSRLQNLGKSNPQQSESSVEEVAPSSESASAVETAVLHDNPQSVQESELEPVNPQLLDIPDYELDMLPVDEKSIDSNMPDFIDDFINPVGEPAEGLRLPEMELVPDVIPQVGQEPLSANLTTEELTTTGEKPGPFEIESAPEKLPQVEETPTVEELPAFEIESSSGKLPQVEETPSVDELPGGGIEPSPEKLPQVEETLSTEELPGGGIEPSPEKLPQVEGTPSADELPEFEIESLPEVLSPVGTEPKVEESLKRELEPTAQDILNPVSPQAVEPSKVDNLNFEELIFPWDEPVPQIGHTNPIKIKQAPLGDPSRTQPIRVKPEIEIQNDMGMSLPIADVSYKRTINHLLSHQSFTCVLVSRVPETSINQELAHFLGEQMTQIASVFGWQLGSIHIQSEYMLWSIQIMPSVSIGNIIRIIRQRTSKRIFTQFPELVNLNASGDYWAPGFLSANSTVPPTEAAIDDFIAQTRRRQDLLNTLEA